jgi:hypothetical protein
MGPKNWAKVEAGTYDDRKPIEQYGESYKPEPSVPRFTVSTERTLEPCTIDWPQVLDVLRERLGKEVSEKWLTKIQAFGGQEDRICLVVEDTYTANYISNNHNEDIKSALWDVVGRSVGFDWLVKSQVDTN